MWTGAKAEGDMTVGKLGNLAALLQSTEAPLPVHVQDPTEKSDNVQRIHVLSYYQ